MIKDSLHTILRKTKKGDRVAQKQLYDNYRVYLFCVAKLYANTKEEAEDFQNVTNRENVYGFDYKPVTLEKKIKTQTGLFPFLNYRIEF